ncbi:hypothetical protein [Chitinophaga polysaccharea]|uniref:hypothetical protein n=1 Tax=Chitinophaga polysaccharea TaxID=1293035 RepID=UPI001454E5F5|nr:hypothetical protein [Chitinophaga polysaccharea]
MPLFIWQLKTLLVSLIKLKVERERIYFLVLLEPGCTPSLQMRKLEKYAQIFYYQERQERIYPASSKPYLFGRFWEQYPENKDKHFLFIESDMLVYREPALPRDENWYWSDATRYLETGMYEYMLGYRPSCGPSFGFHAYGKGADAAFWYKIEKESVDLFIKMNLEATPCNRWICEMRSWMWNSREKFTNIISPELVFNDGIGPRKPSATLYHHLSKKVFSKRDYTTEAPFNINNNVNPNFCLFDYLETIRTAGSLF